MSKVSARAAFHFLALAATCAAMLAVPAGAAPRTDDRTLLNRAMVRPGTPTFERNLERLQAGIDRAAELSGKGGPAPSAVVPGPGFDAWTGNGTPVTTSLLGQTTPRINADGSGGAYVVWNDFRNLSIDIFMNRLDSNGDFASGWTGPGLEVAVRDSFLLEPQVITDGSGGAFVAFSEFFRSGSGYYQDIYLQHVLGTGAIAGGWPAGGKPLNLGEVDGYLVQPDGSGGAFVGWIDPVSQARVLRVDNTGTPVSGWPAAGVTVGPASPTDINYIPDGTGGFYASWAVNDTIRATRVAGNGSVAAGWTAAGNIASAGGSFADGSALALLTSGDVMIGWTDFRFFDVDLFAVRMTSGGGFATGWTMGGVAVCSATGTLFDASAISDGAGGAVFFWTDFRALPNFGFYAQRITGAGAVAPGWTVDGVAMCNPTPSKFTDAVVGDGSGGILAAWTDDPTSSGFTDLFAQYVQGNGTRPVAYPAGGLTVCNAPRGQYDAVITSDNSAGAIIAWDDERDILNPTRVYAARIRNDGTAAHASLANAVAEPGLVRLLWFSPDGASFAATLERDAAGRGYEPIADLRADATGHVRYEDRDVEAGTSYRYRLVVNESGGRTVLGEVELRVPESLALALEPARPNPSAGPLTLAFVLPTAAPATLDLLDVSGRRVLTREVSAAGRNVLRIDESLAPGVYVVRLAHNGRTVSGRVVVTE